MILLKETDTNDLIEREFPPCNDPIEREFYPFSHLFKENRHNGTYPPAASKYILWWAAWAPPRLQPLLQCTSLYTENQHNTCLFTWACGAQLIAQSSRALSPPVPPPKPPPKKKPTKKKIKKKNQNKNKNNNNNKPNRPRLQYVLFKCHVITTCTSGYKPATRSWHWSRPFPCDTWRKWHSFNLSDYWKACHIYQKNFLQQLGVSLERWLYTW